MTSPNSELTQNGWPLKITTTLDPEVKNKCVNGIYKIDLPTQSQYFFPAEEGDTVPAIQLRCHSILVKRPDVVCCCNSVVKTVVGHGSGDQTELIECGKCRTSYLVRTQYDDDGNMDIKIKIYDISRIAKKHADIKRDSNHDVWVSFKNLIN